MQTSQSLNGGLSGFFQSETLSNQSCCFRTRQILRSLARDSGTRVTVSTRTTLTRGRLRGKHFTATRGGVTSLLRHSGSSPSILSIDTGGRIHRGGCFSLGCKDHVSGGHGRRSGFNFSCDKCTKRGTCILTKVNHGHLRSNALRSTCARFCKNTS